MSVLTPPEEAELRELLADIRNATSAEIAGARPAILALAREICPELAALCDTAVRWATAPQGREAARVCGDLLEAAVRFERRPKP